MSFYGLILGLAFVLGIFYFSKVNTIIPKPKETSFSLLLIFFSIIGARIYHIIDNWTYYITSPEQIINFRGGGLGIYGALITGFLFTLVYCRLNKLNHSKLLNQLITIIPLSQSIGRWGNYINTEGFGNPTYIDIGQYVPLAFRPAQFQEFSYFHPTWFYESILDLVLFLFLISRSNKSSNFPMYLIGYGVIRFILEFLRWDTWQLQGFKIAQLLSFVLIITGIVLIKRPIKGYN